MSRVFWKHHYHVVGWLVTFTALLYVGLSGHQNTDQLRRQAAQGAQAHIAVCAFKTDLQRRVGEGIQFLATHPDGALGIPAKTLEASILNEQKTVHSLAALRC
jgi:hypothetical protein